MSSRAASPSKIDPADHSDGWERALLDRQLEGLGRLADMGLAIAGAVERRAVADDPGAGSGADLHHASMDFARVSRAVRMTYALQSSLVADFKGSSEARSTETEKPGQGSDDDDWDDDPRGAVVQRRQMRGIVRRVAVAAALEHEAVERLVREAGEKLEHDDFYADFTTRPVGETLALICADLGLEPDWDRLSSEAWAQNEIARRWPGSPFADWMARRAHAEPVVPPLVPSG